jgi:hypothetical protein
MTNISVDYKFYAALLRFVAKKTDQTDVKVRSVMAELVTVATQLEEGSHFSILASRAQASSRGFAGVAHFLQHRILPEAQAHGNKTGINQIEWAIAASLQIGRAIILHLDKIAPDEIATAFIDIKMPSLDRIAGEHEEDAIPTLH